MRKLVIGQKTRTAVFWLSLIYFSYKASSVVAGVTQNITLGAIGRLFVFCLFVAFLLLTVNNVGFEHIKKAAAFPRIRKFNFFTALAVLIFIAPFLTGVFKGFVPLVSMIAVFVMGAGVLSIYLTLTGKLFNALLIFILNLPFLRLLEWEFGRTAFKWEIFGPIIMTPTILFLLFILLAFLLSDNLHRGQRDKSNNNIELTPLVRWVLILFASFVVSVFVSNNLGLSFKNFLLQIFYPLMFFYLLLKGLRTVKQVKILLYATVAVGILYVFFGFYSILGMKIPTFAELYMLYGELGLARALIIPARIMPFIVAMALSESGAKKIYLIMAVFLGFIFVAASFSRIALLAAVASFIPFLKKKEILITIVIGVLLLVFFQGWFMDNIFIRFKVFDSLEKLNVFYWSPMRLWGIRGAVSIIKEHPLFGVGYAMWDNYYYKYGPPLRVGKDILYIGAAHNTFLDMAVQGGIWLLVGAVGFLGAFFKESLTLFFSTNDKFVRNIALACIGYLILIVVVSFAGNVFTFTHGTDIMAGVNFWSVTAVLIALRNIVKKKEGYK